jgi:hypothetical protein
LDAVCSAEGIDRVAFREAEAVGDGILDRIGVGACTLTCVAVAVGELDDVGEDVPDRGARVVAGSLSAKK